jgi:hypothetical protein
MYRIAKLLKRHDKALIHHTKFNGKSWCNLLTSLTLFVAFDVLEPKGGNELMADFLICLLQVLRELKQPYSGSKGLEISMHPPSLNEFGVWPPRAMKMK